jgi:hypothetical protein
VSLGCSSRSTGRYRSFQPSSSTIPTGLVTLASVCSASLLELVGCLGQDAGQVGQFV